MKRYQPTNVTPPGELKQYLIGDLGVARRHIQAIKNSELPASLSVLNEMEASVERCVARIERDMPRYSSAFLAAFGDRFSQEAIPTIPIDRAVLQIAYDLLTQRGNELATPSQEAGGNPEWDEIIDRAHHALGLLLVRIANRQNLAGRPPIQPMETDT